MYSPHAFHWFDMNDVGGWEVEGGKMEKTTCSGLDFYGGPNKMGSGTKITRIF